MSGAAFSVLVSASAQSPAMARTYRLLTCCYALVLFILLLGQNVSSAAEVESESDADGDLGTHQAQLVKDLSQHPCRSETGASSLAHEDALNRLAGRRIVFIGDSITRCALLLSFITAVCSQALEVRACTHATYTNSRQRNTPHLSFWS